MVLYLVGLKLLPFEKPAGLRLRNIVILVISGLAGGLSVGWKFLADPSQYLTGFGRVNSNPFWILSGVVFYVGIPILCMGAVGAIYLLSKKDRAALLLTVAALFPLLAVLGLSLVQYSANRYIFISLTSWIVLASLAFRHLHLHTEGIARVLLLGVLAILFIEPLSEVVLYFEYQNGNRDNWKAAFQFIQERAEPGDRVAVTNTLLGDYYMGEKTVSMRGMDLDGLPAKEGRVWFVEDLNVANTIPQVLSWIQKNTRLMANFDVHVRARNFKMRVYLFDPSGP
jgi:hypothetical protein